MIDVIDLSVRYIGKCARNVSVNVLASLLNCKVIILLYYLISLQCNTLPSTPLFLSNKSISIRLQSPWQLQAGQVTEGKFLCGWSGIRFMDYFTLISFILDIQRSGFIPNYFIPLNPASLHGRCICYLVTFSETGTLEYFVFSYME